MRLLLRLYFFGLIFLSIRLTAQNNALTDSLFGFDEQAIRDNLMLKNLGVQETENFIKYQKVDFITEKYFPEKSTEVFEAQSTKLSSGNVQTANGSCGNFDFEETAPGTYTAANSVPGWIVSSRSTNVCNSIQPWNPGSLKFALVTTPYAGFPGTLSASPFGGTVVAMLNNTISPAFHETRLTRTLSVTNSNYLFKFAYAARLVSSHNCCEDTRFTVLVSASSCSGMQVIPAGTNCPIGDTTYNNSSVAGIGYSTWKIQTLNLLPHIGQTLTIDFIASDCIYGGHFGQVFLDVDCNQEIIECWDKKHPDNFSVSYCAGSNSAIINWIPNIGFASYQWVAPSSYTLSPQSTTLSALTITNPIANSVFSLNFSTFGGCSFISTVALVPSQVSVSCINTSPSCLGYANGTATVTANGSSTGYNYIWTNITTNSIVSTNSFALGLLPGFYSVSVSAPSGSSCGVGTQTALVNLITGASPTINISPTNTYICAGSQVLLTASGGQSYIWSNGVTTSTNLITTSVSTVYSVIVSSSLNCPATATTLVNVFSPTLTISASPSVICRGDTSIVSAVGAISHSWNTGYTGPTFTANPSLSTIYTLSATAFNNNSSSSLYCPVTQSFQLQVNPLPTISVTGNTLACVNTPFTLQASGANSYTWNNSITTPTLQDVGTSPIPALYIVSGTNSFGCKGKVIQSVSVQPIPTIYITANRLACLNDVITLQASGASSYTWNTGAQIPIIQSTVAIPGPLNFTVWGTGFNGCTSNNIHQMTVDNCMGVDESGQNSNLFSIYPNPNNGNFIVKSNFKTNLLLINNLSQIIKEIELSSENMFTENVSNISFGIYLLIEKKSGKTMKIIVN